MSKNILIISDNLFFLTKLDQLALNSGCVCKKVKNSVELTKEKSNNFQGWDGVILDLSLKIADPFKLLLDIKKYTVKLITFGSHVDAESLNKAKEFGSDKVVTRSQLTTHFRSIVEEALGQ